ncbi:MAG: ribosome biogenesis GTP-binding protein YihA/YsxC [Desulfobacterales bacterium]|nr:ribosome biogenesis GTP-binding protein YihA/YsxC [Desulfobacterales bacterium]MDJ0854340.1 ribosome biogenesis GTP-binding protein YihA/YsxC [Desulfobacterales bacterium]
MIVKSAEFITSAVKPSQYPPADRPEIAFAGRSNVGKSSLINKLVNRRRLVKTSSTPGRTQLVNFFLINQAFRFVDLPGYGYAKVPAGVKRQWGAMIETYLTQRPCLQGLILIVDIRRTPGREEDDLLHWLDHHGIACRLVATKADKLSRNRQVRPLRTIAAKLGIADEALVLFSAKSGLGQDAVWGHIEDLLGISS